MRSQCRLRSRTATVARTHAPGQAAVLTIALLAACGDESVVDPPAALVSASEWSAAAAATSDRDILIALYEATDGPNWVNNENWLSNAPLGEWYGVDTDASGRVVQLDLSGTWDDEARREVAHGLRGAIPSEIGKLIRLERLELGMNSLTGPIPVELGELASLERLILNSNDLSGPIPAELGAATSLTTLDLGYNSLSGPIPSEIGDLPNLRRLMLIYNDLTGPIPPELGNLASLSALWLRDNELSGMVPPELGGMVGLTELSLQNNDLSGPIPQSLVQLNGLRQFFIAGNESLCVPGTSSFVAWLQGVQHNGASCNAGDVAVLETLYELTDGADWTESGGWLGAGAVEEWFGVTADSLGRVTALDLTRNGLVGKLPARLGDLSQMNVLRIGGNALMGRLPALLAQVALEVLDYSGTELCTPADEAFREWLKAIVSHEGTGVECAPLSDREILEILYETTGGRDWEESHNWLTEAPLGEWYGVETDADGMVVSLDLRRNGLEGPIPPALGALTELETLILFRNQLAGPIPPALGALAGAKLIVLAANELSGPIPPELAGLASVEELFLNSNRLTSVPAELGELGNLQALSLNFNRLNSIPAQLGGLAELEYLGLRSNELTSVPPELGELGNLVELDLDDNRLTALPVGPDSYPSLRLLFLSSNEFTSFPWELSELDRLWLLILERNRLTDVPPGSGGFADLRVLDLSSNELTSFPRELGTLGNLRQLELDGNRLTDIPPGLREMAGGERPPRYADESPPFARSLTEPGRPWRLDRAGDRLTSIGKRLSTLDASRTHGEFDRSRSTNGGSRVGGFASIEVLDLSSNQLSGSLPAGLVELTGLASLGLADNVGLTGALPLDLTAMEGLEDLHTTGTELCAPADPTFLDWLGGVTRQRVALCDRDADAAAYLTQSVQSREFPVPLVAGKPALLRVFVTAKRATDVALPPVRATFYQDGAVAYELDIPTNQDPIPAAIDESSLSKSVNAEIPGLVIQPGLEVVIEPDPEGMLDPALGVARRIPATGRMAVDVRAMPVFEVTLVPFIWEENPDSSIVDITAAMAADPGGHELFERTHLLLPVAELDVTAHPAVASPTNNGFEILALTEMIRVAEGGRGHYLGVMAGTTGPGGLLGVANGIGSWSSFSVLDSETIAHEFGHNRNLYHAPCGGAGGPDRYYPYGRGSIGAWGYDFRTGELVPPGRPDFMSYCEPTWTSDYQFTNAVRYRLETETNSILVAAAGARAAASSSRTLLVWGGLDGDGAPYLRPAFFIGAPPYRPSADGAWSLTGRDPGGAELFAVSFAMSEFTDTEDDHAGFTFGLPVTWSGELASMTLQGPGGSASLDRDSQDPLTILREAATGRIRGIVDDPATMAVRSASATAGGQEFEALFSRGIPDPPES